MGNRPPFLAPKVVGMLKLSSGIDLSDLATLLAAVLLGLGAIFGRLGARYRNVPKLSAYECGFDAFEDNRGRFDAHYPAPSCSSSLIWRSRSRSVGGLWLNATGRLESV